MGTIEQALKDADSAMFNPPVNEPKTYSAKHLALMTDDMLDRLLLDGRLIEDVIYGEVPFGGGDLAFSCADVSSFAQAVSNVLTCKRDDLDEHIEKLRYMFTRRLHPMARDMAIEYLENEEED